MSEFIPEEIKLNPFGGQDAEQYNTVFEALHKCAWDDEQQLYDYMEEIPRTTFVTSIVKKINELGFEISRKGKE